MDIDGLELEELETRKSFIEDVKQGEPLKFLKWKFKNLKYKYIQIKCLEFQIP